MLSPNRRADRDLVGTTSLSDVISESWWERRARAHAERDAIAAGLVPGPTPVQGPARRRRVGPQVAKALSVVAVTVALCGGVVSMYAFDQELNGPQTLTVPESLRTWAVDQEATFAATGTFDPAVPAGGDVFTGAHRVVGWVSSESSCWVADLEIGIDDELVVRSGRADGACRFADAMAAIGSDPWLHIPPRP